MDKITHEVRLAQWTEVIKQCQSRPEGMSAAEWLKENGIHESRYYYWQRRVRKQIYNKATAIAPLENSKCEITFSEVPNTALCTQEEASVTLPSTAPVTPDAIIKVGNMEIELHNSLSPMMLKSILEVAAHAR